MASKVCPYWHDIVVKYGFAEQHIQGPHLPIFDGGFWRQEQDGKLLQLRPYSQERILVHNEFDEGVLSLIEESQAGGHSCPMCKDQAALETKAEEGTACTYHGLRNWLQSCPRPPTVILFETEQCGTGVQALKVQRTNAAPLSSDY